MAQATDSNTTRRNFLAGAAVIASTGTVVASPSSATGDAELLLLETEIGRLYAEGDRIHNEDVAPLHDGFWAIMKDTATAWPKKYSAGLEYDQSSGRAAAIDRCDRACQSAATRGATCGRCKPWRKASGRSACAGPSGPGLNGGGLPVASPGWVKG
jgi:hypothetical protein